MDRTTGTLGRIRTLLARAERAGTPAEDLHLASLQR